MSKLIVFTGSPLSGKSALAEEVAKRLSCPWLAMDTFRLNLTPDSHTKADRDVAYRAMHATAAELLKAGTDIVVLDATYMPRDHRSELCDLVESQGSDLYVISLYVSPAKAVERFRVRPEGHAGIDLTEEKVAELVARVQPFSGGLVVDTESYDLKACSERTVDYVRSGSPVQDIRMWAHQPWPEPWSGTASKPASGKAPIESPRLNAASRDAAGALLFFRELILHGSVFSFASGCLFFLAESLEGLFEAAEVLAPDLAHALEGCLRAPRNWITGDGDLARAAVPTVLLVLATVAFTVSALSWRARRYLETRIRIPRRADDFNGRTLVVLCLSLGVGVVAMLLWGVPVYDRMLEKGIFFMAAAIVAAEVLHLEAYLRGTEAKTAWDVKRAGQVPRFQLEAAKLSNADVFAAYRDRTASGCWDRFPIPDLPIFFVIKHGGRFDVDVETTEGHEAPDEALLAQRAGSLGFDWVGFRECRVAEREQTSYEAHWEESVRCLDLRPPVDGVATVVAAKGNYRDYVATEQSVGVIGHGQLPDMRAYFEGPGWDLGTVDLMDVKGASRVYAMKVSVQAIVTTDDGFIVLQRRSDRVGAATGGLGASGAGGALWSDLKSEGNGKRGRTVPFGLSESLLREIEEEIGIPRKHLKGCRDGKPRQPFMAAAFNLNYGRDLNFYAHLETDLSLPQLSRHRAAAKDSWESAHLVFVPVTDLRTDGTLGALSHVLGDSRHVRGALFALANDAKFAGIRAASASCKKS